MFGYEDFYGGHMRGTRRVFENQYQCFSMAIVNKSHLDDGDKILLPPSALDTLSRMNVEYPMLFEIRNEGKNRKTHCGVIEFVAEEGKCHLPYFMMQNLLVEEGSIITIKNISLPKCTFLKVRAQSVDFLDISNPRAVLEYTLRKYTCVTEGDVIVLNHTNKYYHMDVLEVKPLGAASIVETDLEIDFAEPLGYKDSEYAKYEKGNNTTNGAKDSQKNGSNDISRNSLSQPPTTFQRARADSNMDDATAASKFQAFSGAGKRIDGKPTSSAASSTKENTGITSTTSASDMRASGKNSITTSTTTTTSSVSTSSTLSTGSGLKLNASTSNTSINGMSSSSSSNSTRTDPSAADVTTRESSSSISYTSRIGDKYSKKKVAVSAFTGKANKLT